MVASSPEKPILRGVSHQIAFFASLVAGAVLLACSAERFRGGVAVYALTLSAQLGLSALYHRPTWATRARQRMRRLDHAAIFLLIAGTGTPLAFMLDPHSRNMLLWILWIGAAVGVLRALLWIGAPKPLVAVIAVVLGWGTFPFLPALGKALDPVTIALIVAGGALYSLGAVAYATRRPDPWPRVFGYHEVFHAFTIVAAICHFLAIERSVVL